MIFVVVWYSCCWRIGESDHTIMGVCSGACGWQALPKWLVEAYFSWLECCGHLGDCSSMLSSCFFFQVLVYLYSVPCMDF
jgi:hypothetical protein